MLSVSFLRCSGLAECPARRLGDFFAMMAVVLYEVFTCWNLYSYIQISSVYLSGSNYDGYGQTQFLLNPLIRTVNINFPIIEQIFYNQVMGAGGDWKVNFLLFSFLEIAILDFLLGSLMWYLLARILMGFMQRGSRR